MEDPLYYELRERIIGFLEHNAPHQADKAVAVAPEVSEAAAVEALA
jgi:hypothetical protein